MSVVSPAVFTADAALACDSVSKVFPVIDEGTSWRVMLGYADVVHGIRALDGVSLSVPKGKLCGMLGRNGAGKSTLLRVMGGVYAPTRGAVRVEGRLSALFELGGMGNRQMTGREFARRSLALQGAPRAAIPGLIDEVLDFSELGPAFDDRILTYSSGMAARLYFACATVLQHEVYLIDEILSVGDEHFQAKCWARVRERLAGGASGLLVTHDWSAVIKLCEMSYILDRGRIEAFGPTDQIVARYLDLQMPDSSIAHFIGGAGDEHVATSGADATLPVVAEIGEHAGVALAFSIELLRIGIGWEILILGRNLPVGSAPGVYDIRVNIRNLPLPAGEYSMNLWLHNLSSRTNDPHRIVTYDARSWTYGNGCRLRVEGAARPAVTCPALEWSVHEPR